MTAFLLPCWTYDAYIVFRDGVYPPSWLPNLGLSGPISLSAGLFWNLRPGPTYFAFREPAWPDVDVTRFRDVALLAVIGALPVLVGIW